MEDSGEQVGKSQGGRPISEIRALRQLEKEIIEEEQKKGLYGKQLERTVIAKMMAFTSYYTARKYYLEIMSGTEFEDVSKDKEVLAKRLQEAELEKNRLKERLTEIYNELGS